MILRTLEEIARVTRCATLAKEFSADQLRGMSAAMADRSASRDCQLAQEGIRLELMRRRVLAAPGNLDALVEVEHLEGSPCCIF